MELGKRYVVTKASDDGTFQVGDHIKLEKNGDVICREAQGWISSEFVVEAIKGMEYKVDKPFYDNRKAKLLKELESIG